MTSANRKLNLKREPRQLSTGPTFSSSPVPPGKTAKDFASPNELGFVRGVDTNSNQVGFVKPKVQSLPSDFSWEKLMPAKWAPSELKWPEFHHWWRCHFSRVVMIGAVSGILIALLSAGLERVSYENYSNEGSALLNGPEPMKAVAYFRNEACREGYQTWVGAPRHVAALEGLAVAYERAGFRESAVEAYGDAVRAVEKAPVLDKPHLIALLGGYHELLERCGYTAQAREVESRLAKFKSDYSLVALMVMLIVLSLACYALYAANCLLEDKRILEEWKFYYWFSLVPFVGFVCCFYSAGVSILGCLAFALVINYMALPGLVHCLVEIGRSAAPYWYNALTSRKNSRK